LAGYLLAVGEDAHPQRLGAKVDLSEEDVR